MYKIFGFQINLLRGTTSEKNLIKDQQYFKFKVYCKYFPDQDCFCYKLKI